MQGWQDNMSGIARSSQSARAAQIRVTQNFQFKQKQKTNYKIIIVKYVLHFTL